MMDNSYSNSYKGTETILVKYKDTVHLASFEQLFDLVDEPITQLERKDRAVAKYTKDLYVWDNQSDWTFVSRVIRKHKTEEYRFIRTKNGKSQIVTSKHPMITSVGDVDASDITAEHILNTLDISLAPPSKNHINDIIWALDHCDKNRVAFFRGRPFIGVEGEDTHDDGQVTYYSCNNPIQNKIIVDYSLGWLTGIALADGYVGNGTVRILNQNEKILDRIIDICEDRNLGYSVNTRVENGVNTIIIRSRIFADVLQNCFGENFNKKNSAMNANIMSYPFDFIQGIIGGVIDGDGAIREDGNSIEIKTTSRTMINQISFLIKAFGNIAIDGVPVRPSTAKPIGTALRSSYIHSLTYVPVESENGWTGFGSVLEEDIIVDGEKYKRYSKSSKVDTVTNNIVLDWDIDVYVYDISTETKHFICNNIYSHNCCNA